MGSKNKNILIIGGGPAGLACAYELHRAGLKTTILEKDSEIGGLAKTLIFKEGKYIFRTDIGPHRFYSKNKYLHNLIEKLLAKKWILVRRQTRQIIEGKFYDYPVNAIQAFKNIGPFRAAIMSASYAYAMLKYKVFRKKINNFEDYIVSNFGRKLGEFNMFNYTEKVWGLRCSQIHPDWGIQRIKGLDLRSTLANALFRNKKERRTLVDQFNYPSSGTGLIYQTIKDEVSKSCRILTGSYPTKIYVQTGRVKKVESAINGKPETFTPDFLVSSMPITEIVKIIEPAPPKKVLDAANQLKWRDQKYIFITLDKNKITDDNWIYFPNIEVPFGRIAEMKNFSKEMSPKNKTSIFVEFFMNEGDDIWNMDDKELFEMTIKFCEEFKLFKRKDVRKYYVLKKSKVYPVYDIDYKKHLKVVKDYLNGFKNLHYIGRPGRFQYTNQDHSLEMGILTAKSITENKSYNLDDVGTEKQYFEGGDVKNETS